MKRTIINGCAWLAVILLFFVLFHVMRQDDPGLSAPAIPISHTDEMAGWIRQRQQLEKDLQNRDQALKNASRAPTSVFLMFATADEAVISKAAAMTDVLKTPALLGISEHMLAMWQESGLPSYVQERLQAGWEICLLLEEMHPTQMQQILSALGLPTAVCAYDSPKNIQTLPADDLLAAGIRILVEDGVPSQYPQDGLWHIASLGAMHPEGMQFYEQYRNTGSAFVNIIGSYRAEQTFTAENLEGLLELIREDSHLGSVQCLHLEAALHYHRQYLARLEKLQAEWSVDRAQLEKELQAVTDKITNASSLLNQ